MLNGRMQTLRHDAHCEFRSCMCACARGGRAADSRAWLACGCRCQVLYDGVRSVTDLMVMPGLINLDFADVRAIMKGMGKAMMGTGESDVRGTAPPPSPHHTTTRWHVLAHARTHPHTEIDLGGLTLPFGSLGRGPLRHRATAARCGRQRRPSATRCWMTSPSRGPRAFSSTSRAAAI
jgi:hypothetical protein